VKKVVAAFLFTAMLASPVLAWEAQTTHAGLAEQAATGSVLHTRLVELGFSGGLYDELTVPPDDAPALMASLAQYSPAGGFTPDSRGRQFAVGWLVAGAVMADSSADWAANHFYDPTTGAGLSAARSLLQRVTMLLGEGLPPTHGTSALDWISSKDNPLSVVGFAAQYARAIRGATPAERQRDMAGALIAAGAVLHVLQDLGSPSHVRDDLQAHLDRLGPARDDLGSRFERIAALAYGRLGVPAADPIARTSLAAFFHDADGRGLADLTSASYFSASTLPRDVSLQTQRARDELEARLTRALVRPLPSLPSRLNLLAAGDDDGASLDSAAGTCLARYHVQDGTLSFSTDDDCLLEQVDAILPQVVGYGAGLIDHLFRGELVIAPDLAAAKGTIAVLVTPRAALGAGTLELFSEDARGVRTAIGAPTAVTSAAAGAVVGTATAPEGGVRIVALFTGVDGTGEAVVAAGSGS